MEFGKNILLVFSELPYPARLNGISVRYAPIITELSKRHNVDVAIIARLDETRYPTGLDEVCRSVKIFQRAPIKTSLAKKIAIRLTKCFSAEVPYPLYSYDNAAIEQFLRVTAESCRYDSIVWVGSMHLEVGIRVFGEGVIVHDAIDSLYHTHLRNRHGSIFHKLDCAKIEAWERYLVGATKRTSFVSHVDAGLFERDAVLAKKVAVFPNGVFLGDFGEITPVRESENVLTLGFLGHMGYRPNIDAILRLYRIFELVRARDPGFRLLIIGREPAEEVRMLGEKDGVTVTGSVENIWEYIAKVDIFVFPMVSGAGQQNKVLEAMYGGKMVICNALANSGIGAVADSHLVIKETDEEFAAAILSMKNNEEVMNKFAMSGRDFVRDKYSWEKIIPLIEEFWLSK